MELRRGQSRLSQDLLPTLLFLDLLDPLQALRLSAGDYVVMASGLDLLEVFVERHAAVHDHRTSTLAPCALLQGLQHLIDGRPILAIAVEDLMGFGKALPVEHQADDDLFAVRPLIARITSLSLGIALAFALEVSRGQIVEIVAVVQIEKRLLSACQSRLDRAPVGVQAIEIAIQGFVG